MERHSRAYLTGIVQPSLIVAGLRLLRWAKKRPQIETTKVDGTDNVYIFRQRRLSPIFIVTTYFVIATESYPLLPPYRRAN